MIKRSYYIKFISIIVLSFALFQLTSIGISFRDHGADSYSNNKAADIDISTNLTDFNAFFDLSVDEILNTSNVSKYSNILLVTGDNHSVSDNIMRHLLYLKRSFRVEDSLLSISDTEMEEIDVIILASKDIDGVYNVKKLKECLEHDIDIIMAVLPDQDKLTQGLQKLIGIDAIGDSIEQKGITIVEGFLFGGRQEYNELSISAQDIKVSDTCKIFILGNSHEEADDRKHTDKSAVIWRNVYEAGRIYVINGDFFSDYSGVGIMSGLLAQIYPDFIYPVINARSLIVNNAPILFSENKAELQRRYARDAIRLYEDIILPDIICLCMKSGNVPTFCYSHAISKNCMEEGSIDVECLKLTHAELNKIGGELNDNIPTITKGYSFTDEGHFMLSSMATALGVITHEIDMREIIYPRFNDDDWTIRFKEFTLAVNTQLNDYKYLASMTISKARVRLTRYLNLEPEITIGDNSILLYINGFDTEAYFILRTQKVITGITNGSFVKLEEGAYLITALNEKVSIDLR